MIYDKNNDTLNLNPNQKTVLYLDANNLIFRAFYASEASKVNPIHIILNMAYSIKTNMPNDFSFAIFDGEKNKESRLEIYPEYKSNRAERTEEEKEKLSFLKEKLLEVFDILGYTVYHSKRIEADDVIGILSRRSIDKNFNVIAYSSDKDYKQLCQYGRFLNIVQMTQSKGEGNILEITNADNFSKKYNYPITSVVDYLSLIGDDSDGVKGVNKVGPKTAEKWLMEFGSIDGIKNNLDKIKDGNVKTNLIEAIQSGLLDLNKKLIGFHYHEENTIDIKKEDIKSNKIDIPKLDEFCIQYNLNQFREKYIEPLIQMKEYNRKEDLQNLLKEKQNKSNNYAYKMKP